MRIVEIMSHGTAADCPRVAAEQPGWLWCHGHPRMDTVRGTRAAERVLDKIPCGTSAFTAPERAALRVLEDVDIIRWESSVEGWELR